MKRSDIPDQHVIDLARAWWTDRSQPGVVHALIAEGVPAKLAVAKVLHLADRGLLEYGSTPTYAWPTDMPDLEPCPQVEPYLRIMQDAINRAVTNYKTAMGERP